MAKGSSILAIRTQIQKNSSSFAFDAPTVWNEIDVDDVVHSAPTLACFKKKAKILSFR